MASAARLPPGSRAANANPKQGGLAMGILMAIAIVLALAWIANVVAA
jgi:hypothetical protein